MKLAPGITLLTYLLASALAVAQEKMPPELLAGKSFEIRDDGECLAPRMVGIAEPSERYNAYVLNHCPLESIAPAPASVVIRDLSTAYRDFLRRNGR